MILFFFIFPTISFDCLAPVSLCTRARNLEEWTSLIRNMIVSSHREIEKASLYNETIDLLIMLTALSTMTHSKVRFLDGVVHMSLSLQVVAQRRVITPCITIKRSKRKVRIRMHDRLRCLSVGETKGLKYIEES
jgi:hypothetical protein